MFRTVLVANRGEIACRVIRTARSMGIRTVAVYSEADCRARHVAMADEAYPIGPAPVRESYLRIDAIVEAARRAGAEAIHPGYGFLSENAEFAEACAAAGIVFVGPPAAAIRAMGSKSAAKALMEEAGVALVAGYHGANQDPRFLAAEAERIGFPVLIKASAGGGGKGMRVVESPAAFADLLSLAQGEARASFGDDRVLIERYLTHPRHIEIQVFADTHGRVVSLFERDCSIQRRHQKILEEAPAPGMDPARRQAMGEAACAAARAAGYVGAGTVEFISQDGAFYFMEMNTRLQVEHPVTEFITGLDLVEWQFRVAAGERLPELPSEPRGHAIEVRIYAEDPAREYMPCVGTLRHLRMPDESKHVRVDTGVQQGDQITVHYDPMIAKLIVWDTDRLAAARRLRTALQGWEISGVQTNLGLLRRIADHEAFLAAELDTGFLGRFPDLQSPPQGELPALALAAGVARILADLAETSRRAAQAAGDPGSPWALVTAWRLNGEGYQDFVLRHGEAEQPVRVFPRSVGSFDIEIGGRRLAVAASGDGDVRLDGVLRRAPVVGTHDALAVIIDGVEWPLQLVDPLRPSETESAGADRLTAPMPGRVVSVHTQAGARVKRGDVLLVLEAMKVQLRITAPRDATVAVVHSLPGGLVDEGAELVSFAADAG